MDPASAVKMVAQPSIDFAKEKWKYIWNYKKYVSDLEGERKRLECVNEEVNHEVEEARDNGRDIEKEATDWLKEAGGATKEARDVQEKKEQKSCFRGTIFNPYTRYIIRKEAELITQTIQQLETRKTEFRRIYCRSAPGKVTGSYEGISYYASLSRDAILRDVNKGLVYSDAKMVGVYGASGVGKSTLLMQVRDQVHRKILNYDFGVVAMASVTQDPDVEKFSDELAYSLNLKFENEITATQKGDRLRVRLSQGKKILIILDDISKKLDLDKIGIPIKDSRTSIKLLLTSRSEEILKHEMDCRHNFELRALSKEEALDLFKRTLGRQMEDELLMELVGREIVEECSCLPVYIVPLATHLKMYGPSTWKNALDDLRESNKLGMNKFLEEALKDTEAKKLFFMCCQIGTQIIRIEDLLAYGIGLGLFEGINTKENYREKLTTLLENLTSICFLEGYGNDCIKRHDVMSEASLFVAQKSRHFLVLRDRKQIRDHLENAKALKKSKSISLAFVGDIIGGLPKKLECPKLKMFISYTDEQCVGQFPDKFFEELKNLKVLNIYRASFFVLLSSFQCLKELQTICLDRCSIE